MTRRSAATTTCLCVAFAAIAVTMLVACDSSDKPAAATPAALTIAPTAVPTPSYPHIRLRVIDDIDADGLADAGELGIPGAFLIAGCYDSLSGILTDSDGYGYVLIRGEGDEDTCFYLMRQVGWQPTSDVSIQLNDYPRRGIVELLVHDLGDDVTEIHGKAIRGGLPVTDLGPAEIAPPFDSSGGDCAVSFYEDSGRADTIVIVVGSSARARCPSAGDAFDIIAEGELVASDIVFAPGDIIWHDLVVGDDSMRFYASGVDRAEVLDADGNLLASDCAVVLDYLGVFVLPDSVRAGCGAPGRIVRFFSDTRTPEPSYYWQPGRVKIQAPYPASTPIPAPPQFAP